MNYDDYIRSELWSAKRRTRLDFARQRCELCNRSDRLDVHHRTDGPPPLPGPPTDAPF